MAIHSACQSLGIEPHGGAVSSQGQHCLSMGAKSANRVSALCFSRWGWSPVTIVSDSALPRLKKGVWIGTEIIPALSPMQALNMLYGMTPIETARDAEALVAWAEDNPEQLTNGEALRGLAMVRRHLADERYPEA